MKNERLIAVGALIDGLGSPVRKRVYLQVKKSIIYKIGPLSDLPSNSGIPFDDLSHCIILPPLVDCSVYLSRSPSVDDRVQTAHISAELSNVASLFSRHLSYCEKYGVLGVAEHDDISRLLTAPIVNHQNDSQVTISMADSRPEDSALQPGPVTQSRHVRIRFTADIDTELPSGPTLDVNMLHRILSRKGPRKTIVTANGVRQIAEAVFAGCDAIEQGYGINEEILKAMARDKVVWIPNLLRAKNGLDSSGSGGDVCCRFSQRYVAPGKATPGAEEFWSKTLADQLAMLRLARKLGVRTATGTAAGTIGILHGESMVEEMKLFMKAGYSLEEIVQCASETGAAFLGFDRLGGLAVGKPATFLMTRGSVSQLPRKLSFLEGMYLNGTSKERSRL